MAEDNLRIRQREEVRTQTHTAPANATATSSAMQTREADGVCPKCGAAISADMELCPVCGWKVVDYCTFCGAPMTPDDMDCPECGMPADGVLCPDCGVRNFRPFCRQCGKLLPISTVWLVRVGASTTFLSFLLAVSQTGISKKKNVASDVEATFFDPSFFYQAIMSRSSGRWALPSSPST